MTGRSVRESMAESSLLVKGGIRAGASHDRPGVSITTGSAHRLRGGAGMSRAERALAWLLRFEAVVLLCALPAAFLPTDWMDAIGRRLGLGELPRAPLVEYLTRSLSLLYAGWGPVLLVLASDLRRYLPLVWLYSWMALAFGPTVLVLDLVAGMPPGWIVSEAVMVNALGVAGILLLWRVDRERRAG